MYFWNVAGRPCDTRHLRTMTVEPEQWPRPRANFPDVSVIITRSADYVLSITTQARFDVKRVLFMSTIHTDYHQMY